MSYILFRPFNDTMREFMYICIYVCMYMCMYICIYVFGSFFWCFIVIIIIIMRETREVFFLYLLESCEICVLCVGGFIIFILIYRGFYRRREGRLGNRVLDVEKEEVFSCHAKSW